MNKKRLLRKELGNLSWSMLTGLMISGALITNAHAGVVSVGQGSFADAPNPAGFICSVDYGNWIHNAGVVEPAIPGCDPDLGPIGEPTPLYPHISGPAAEKHTGTHRWWGSISFFGEMPVGDVSKSGYITPDPITARLTNRGFRMMGIPNGLQYQNGNSVIYAIPDPFSEVFDGLAIANSQHANMNATMYDYSDGSVTVEWKDGNTSVMRATFVYGSPYVYLDILSGNLVVKSKAEVGGERGNYFQDSNKLGLWTSVAGNRNSFLVVGEGDTQFNNVESADVEVVNNTGRVTVAWLPVSSDIPSTAMINDFASVALNKIDEVLINYTVDDVDNDVRVQHRYLNNGAPVDTLVGQMPLQWKNNVSGLNSNYQVRSARGIVKFTPVNNFTYEMPFVGVLPTLPASTGSYDVATLRNLIQEFLDKGEAAWNDKNDTYWAGKNYGKVAELAALAHSHGMTAEHARLINWLKGELEDWFTASTNGTLDVTKYFSYDDTWNTLLGYDESFGAQQQLNDHHFHYGYFVRAAAEICRTDKSWCAPEAWGGMVEMLIRDYAATRNDSMYPYARNFDPANGFSWASGHANFVLGNNNESTSEAANAYGSIVLYGLITGNEELTKHGMYLHASSTAAYWEYWNNIDRYRGLGGDYDNFPAVYEKMTTSIIWGNGMVFSTWFSGAYAHILGIQGLPLNPMVMHIGQHADYLKDYVALGLSESSNGLPSGLGNDQWRDVWWNILAMTDAPAAIADFNSMNFSYDVEAGETKAHTYQWIHSFNELGHLVSGNGQITANYPSALVFEKNGQLTYLAYNYSNTPKLVTFSDGMAVALAPNSFGKKHTGETPDTLNGDLSAPTTPANVSASQVSTSTALVSWSASSDNVGVQEYVVTVSPSSATYTVNSTSVQLSGLTAGTAYNVSVVARDAAQNSSNAASVSFTTQNNSGGDTAPTAPTGLATASITQSSAVISWVASTDDQGVAEYAVVVLQNGNQVQSLTTTSTQTSVSGLAANTAYSVEVVAVDTIQQRSSASTVSFTTQGAVVACDDFCFEEQGSTLIVTSNVGTIVDMHYTVNSGAQQNVRMVATGSQHVYEIYNLAENDVVDYFFTVIETGAYDTSWAQYTFGGQGEVRTDSEAPTQPGTPSVVGVTTSSVSLTWAASSDNVGVDQYQITVAGVGSYIATANSITINGLTAQTSYNVSVVALDAAGNTSGSASSSFTTQSDSVVTTCTDICATEINGDTLRLTVMAGGIADAHYTVNGGAQNNVRMNVVDGHHEYDISGLSAGSTVRFFMTVIDGPAYDSAWQEHVFGL